MSCKVCALPRGALDHVPGQKPRAPSPKGRELLLLRRRYRSPAVSRARESLYATRAAIGSLGVSNRPPNGQTRLPLLGRGGSSNGSNHHATKDRLFCLDLKQDAAVWPAIAWDDRRMTGALRTGLRVHKPPSTAIQQRIRPFTHRMSCAHLPPVPAFLHSWTMPETQQPWSAQILRPIISLCRHTLFTCTYTHPRGC